MDNLRGILLLVLAMACFAMEDMFVKTASAHMSIGQILGLLGIGGGIAFAVLAKSSGHRLFSASSLHKTVILRNLGELIGTLSFVTAITTSALSTSTAIFQAAPLATTLCAAVFLKEPVGWRRWSAIAVGFIGVLLIVRPGSASFEPASLFAVGAVVGLAARDVATRVLPRDISSQVIACYAFAVIGIAGFALQLFEDTFFVPMDAADWGNIIG
ncbi:MAG: DMT family transporter, partial [Pseudomonadota bacterium]|nr:DMT family transporter [Pseudomonadota bacterium]